MIGLACLAGAGGLLGCGSSGGGGTSSGSGGGSGSGSGDGFDAAGTGGTGGPAAGGTGGAQTDGDTDTGVPIGSGGASGRDAAGTGGAGGAAPGPLPVPASREEFLKTLLKLDDLLLTTQITQNGAANFGALVSPSTNPSRNPVHSRAAEAVYPLAIAFKYQQDARYADAAIRLGTWLTTTQLANGSWIEEWPSTTGWDGTTADQLISLAGAYVILKPRMTASDASLWVNSITRSADWVAANFPRGNNINYTPTGAVALLLAARAVPNPKPVWTTKAASLMATTLQSINADGLIDGEGGGVDLGYNIAQSIGFIAAYGRILPSPMHVDKAAELMLAHLNFMYPNGAIDNSWGTRTYKWMFESGTKTAPGVFLGLGILADKSPVIRRAGALALAFLRERCLDDKGWIMYGPSAGNHPSSTPPDNYSTFARAQSIAMAIDLGPATLPTDVDGGAIPADQKNWAKYFPTVATGLVRTDRIMATITAYGAIGTYPRATVARGGSISALWFAGYGPTGFLQVSSQTIYSRVEALHMPTEGDLLPLTARIETTGGALSTNLYDDQAKLSVKSNADGAEATATGTLRDVNGGGSGTTFTWAYLFTRDSYSKEVTISTARGVRIVEPFVDVTGNQYALLGTDGFQITTAGGGTWTVKVVSSSGAYQLTAGTDRARYWSPFPGVDAYPLIITPDASATAPFKIKYTISKTN
ncbi:MAG TPA: hypothetical protein VNO55_11725 [Polyangia bacterium]|nr:hypothetical protein [Polyangia bacterium]